MNSQELKDYILSLPPLPAHAPEFTWLGRCITLRRHIQSYDPKDFLNWSVIQATMNADYKAQGYHLDLWQQETELKIASLNSIVEFGGGYGAMLKVLREYGFTGDYYGYDFPEFIALQEYFTQEKISTELPAKADLLIAICSLSEADLATRETFLAGFNFTHYLIRYQQTWDGIDNHLYFSQINGKRINIENDHWYLIR